MSGNESIALIKVDSVLQERISVIDLNQCSIVCKHLSDNHIKFEIGLANKIGHKNLISSAPITGNILAFTNLNSLACK